MNQKTHNPPNPEGRRNSSVSSFKKSLHRCLNLYSKYLLTTHPNKTFNKIVILLFITSCITIFACRERVTPPPDTPQYNPPIVLSLEDVSCTDAFLRVRFVDTTIERSFILKRDGATVASVANSPLDTMLIDENLLPKRIYRYKAYRVKGGVSVDSSMELTIETMDTTSHDFTWQIDTLGDGASSVLYDVAIINDTLAYAVGEIYKRDSLGNWDPTFYNLAKWNGRQWTLHRVYYNGGIFTARWILAFSENDILIEELIHWNGTTFRPRPIDPMFYGVRTTKAWGTSSSDFYVVGNNGFIAHYDGARWRRIESGTTLPIRNIYGAKNLQTGKYQILCVADGYSNPDGSYILSIENNNVRKLWNDPRPYGLDEIWFVAKRKYIVVGSGVWSTFNPEGNWILENSLPMIHTTCISGNGLNDIIVGGAFLLLCHYNGYTWETYFPVGMAPGSFVSVKMKDNLLIAVGGFYNRAIALIGRR